MRIPKTVHKNGHTYTFIQRCNDDLFLYKSDLGFNETFKRVDLGLIDNLKIDTLMGFKNYYVLYDRVTETEKIYYKVTYISKDIDVDPRVLVDCINLKKWIKERYFVERRVKEE